MKNIVISFLLLISFASSSCYYNGFVEREEKVKSQWAQVENAYQRRADLIPNLVKTVQGYANFEKSTLEAVVQARASATSVKIDASKLTPEQIEAFDKAQSGLSGALSRLLMVAEKYPDLKANQNFLELQAQLEGTENRISVERNKFNEAVNNYNTAIKKFPGMVEARMFGFSEKTYFKAAAGSEKAPEVKFE
ncbi:MAG: LemA family protein [Bacteroidia bacterium]|nr:LemA family protein [Bacteroidia bacterium]